MKTIITTIILGIALLGCTCSTKSASSLQELGTMPSFEAGYEQGVSACYSAAHADYLYIAGGCNFPETPAAQGGAKRYYKGIYKAHIKDTLIWEKCGELPCANAYGANIQCGNKWIIAGGMNKDGAFATVLSIDLAEGCHIDTLPPLPYKTDNTAGANSGDKIFVVGGNCDATAQNNVFVLDINNRQEGWKQLPAMPGKARVQPVCAATANKLYVWGGFTPKTADSQARVHTDGACYDMLTGTWEALPDVTIENKPMTLSGGIAALLDDSTIVAAGGVNKDIFTDAISGSYQLTQKEEYMHKPYSWYRFNPNLLQYNVNKKSWELLHSSNSLARAGASIVIHNNNILYIGGELKPGIRTPKIVVYTKNCTLP